MTHLTHVFSFSFNDDHHHFRSNKTSSRPEEMKIRWWCDDTDHHRLNLSSISASSLFPSLSWNLRKLWRRSVERFPTLFFHPNLIFECNSIQLLYCCWGINQDMYHLFGVLVSLTKNPHDKRRNWFLFVFGTE
jgi:hypothetical protein